MCASVAARVLDYTKAQEQVLIGLLERLVEAESPSANPEVHDEVRRVLRLALADVGYESRETGGPNRHRHLFARPPGRAKGAPTQLLLGHLDTVWPVGTIDQRPFRVDGNVVHGPGSFDMKAGLAEIVIALGAVRDLRLDTPAVPIVFVNADEEMGSRSSTRYIRLLAQHARRALVMEPALGERGDLHMQALTSAGLMGRYTSFSTLLAGPLQLRYRGHLCRGGRKLCMRDFAIRSETYAFSVPTLLVVGTSMSAGKTTTGRRVCKELDRAGRFVIGAKLTGAGRYRDILSFLKTGATEICDFVDAGLPSTVVPAEDYRAAIRPLLNFINDRGPDLLVAEAGASPLEPYNGAALIDELGDNIVCTILCASDPYAVVGVQQAFNLTPDLVAGPATTTTAAVELVRKLTGLRGINILDPANNDAFRKFLRGKFPTLLP